MIEDARRPLINRDMGVEQIHLAVFFTGKRFIQAGPAGTQGFHFRTGQLQTCFKRFDNRVVAPCTPVLRSDVTAGRFLFFVFTGHGGTFMPL